jgi:hypothetical protein
MLAELGETRMNMAGPLDKTYINTEYNMHAKGVRMEYNTDYFIRGLPLWYYYTVQTLKPLRARSISQWVQEAACITTYLPGWPYTRST